MKKVIILKEKRRRASKNSFWEFCLYMDPDFFKKRQAILEPIAHDMQRLIAPIGPQMEFDILNVSLPPRTGKSYLCTLFCAWALGKFPEESIMRNTVTGRLYAKFSNDLKMIITGEANGNRFNEVFEGIELATAAVEGWRLKQSKQGVSYFGGGIEGTIIGMGASLLSVLDDSVKDEFDALNTYALDKKWGWYGSTADSREEKGCKKLFIGTRWSKFDIVGRLKELGFFDGPKAKEIVVPALISGQSYCDHIHTTESLLNKKKITSDIIWEAEWMQNPVEAKGLLFPVEELKRFSMVDLSQKPEAIVCAGDIADEGTDSLSVPMAYVYNDGDKVYVVDVKFTTEPIEITQPTTAAYIDEWNPSKAKFESNNGGKGFAMEVKRLITGKTHVEWERTSQNKHTRILMASGQIKEHFYFRDDFEPGGDYERFMRQLITYNKQGTSKHDDAADSITMLKEMLYSKSEARIRSL